MGSFPSRTSLRSRDSQDLTRGERLDNYNYDNAKFTADLLLQQTKYRPTIGVICGSGLGGFAKVLRNPDTFEYHDIPHFPVSTVQGHEGRLVFGTLHGKSLVVMQGRVHMYAGYSAKKVTFPVRVFKLLGVSTLIVTNACGAINRSYNVGDLVLICDHINFVGLSGLNPLVGPNDERFGPRFPGMTNVYDKELRRNALKLAKDLDMAEFVREGVYVFVCGPFYESVSEIRMLSTMGADVAGMSTVPEVVVARHCGMRVFGVSLVTNSCVIELDSEEEPNHEEVLEMGEQRSGDMQQLIGKLIAEMD